MTDRTIQMDFEQLSRPETLFKPASWLSKIEFINHLILFNNVLMTVLAEKDGGKTSFIQLLQESLDAHVRTCAVTAKPSHDSFIMMTTIADAFHLKHQNDMSSLVHQINERKAHVLLVIDDAQHLDPQWIHDALTAIKHQGNHGYFHLCLVADFSIVATLNKLSGSSFKNLIHTIELSGLNEEETKTYIKHKAILDKLDESLFTDESISKIYQSTAGDLAKIHASMSLHATSYQNFPLKAKHKRLKQTSIAASIALFAAGLTYYSAHHNIGPTEPEQFVSTQEDTKTLASQLPSLEWQWVQQSTIPSINLDTQHVTTRLESPALASNITGFPGFKKQPVNLVTNTSKPQPPSAEQNLYTIQLIATQKKETIIDFLKKHQIKEKTNIYQVTESSGQWFILTLGDFNNLNAAKKEISHLPTSLTKLAPWIRPTEGLKKG